MTHRRTRSLTKDEVKRLLGACKSSMELEWAKQRTACLTMLLLLTGARVGEWRSARWSWVDWHGKRLLLPPDAHKSGGSSGEKEILIPDSGMRILDKWMKEVNRSAAGPLEWIFPGDKKGRPLVNTKNSLKFICKMAGIEPFKFHDLRRTFASFALNRGVSIGHLSPVLGHSSTRMTESYARLGRAEKREAADMTAKSIEEVLDGGLHETKL